MNTLTLERNGTLARHARLAPTPSEPAPADATALRTRVLAIGAGSGIDGGLCDYLARFEIDLQLAGGEAQIRRQLAPGRFDLVLLDLVPSGELGLRLCLWVRQLVPGIPVIVLTPPDDLAARVAALDLGADDCLARPFEPRELAARIKAVLRRLTPRTWLGQSDRFDEWVFDRTHRQLVLRDGSVVGLSAYEARLLSVFIEHPRQLLTRDRLLAFANVSDRSVTYRSVDLAISRLRSKLGDDAHRPTVIRTVRGEGYLFTAGPRL
jgi:two-component system OmpR family response regulator